MIFIFIYKITNIINGKVYIGKTEKTIQGRFNVHLKNAKNKINRYLYDAMNHYGYDKFIIEEIEACLDSTSLNEKEKYWIGAYNSTNKNFGYNMTEGGTGGAQLPEIAKLSGIKAALTRKKNGYKVSVETRHKISKAHKGKKISEEIKIQISKKLTGRKLPLNQIQGIKDRLAKFHPMRGKKQTEEAKLKMSIFKQGKTWEELSTPEIAKQRRQKAKERFSGINNPKWRVYKIDNYDKLIELVLKGFSIKQLCQEFNVSYYFLLIDFKKKFNMTINQYRLNKHIKVKDKKKREPLTQEIKDKISIATKIGMMKAKEKKIHAVL